MKFTVKKNGTPLAQFDSLGDAWDAAWLEVVTAGGRWAMDRVNRAINESVKLVCDSNIITVER